MRQKLGLTTTLDFRPAVFLGLLALTLLSVIVWPRSPQAQVYGSVSSITTGAAPWSPSLGDLNGDGWPDLVVANSGDNNVAIFWGIGGGTFNPTPTIYDTGTDPRGNVLGDLNGDGKLDLVVANFGSNNVWVFLGKGDGTFAEPTAVTTGTNPNNLILGDVNRDGKLDLLVTNYGSGDVSVFFGIGDGTFTPMSGSPFSTGTKPMALRLGDLNSDGNPDLVVANYESNTISIFLGTGGGSFNPAVPPTIPTNTGPTGVRLADLNDDGVFDLVVANSGTIETPGNTVTVYLGNKNEQGKWDGTFQAMPDITTEAAPTAPHLADMNSDGALDLIVVNNGATDAAHRLSIFPGNGDGTFQAKVDYEAAAGPTGVAVGDLDGDGMPDLAVAGTSGNAASIFKNTTTVLAVFPNGSGRGDITSDIGGITCPSSPTICRAYFSSSGDPVTVTVTATPSAGSTFIGWSGGGCLGTGTTCTVTMEKSRAIAAMFQKDGSSGFTLAHLAGTWFFTYLKDSVTGNSPGWTSLVMTLNESGAVTGGSFTDSSGSTGQLFAGDGAFIIDGAGLISGWAGPQGGRMNFPYGKLSPSKTILAALSLKGPNGRGMIVGTKGGGTFTSSDLAGTWHGSYFADYFPTNDPSWASVTLNINASGAVTSGDYTGSQNDTGLLSGGSFPINSNGVITSGSITSEEGGGPTFPMGKLDASKTMFAAAANEEMNGRGGIISIKGGGSYSTADLAGTWYFLSYLDRFPTNNPQWAVATLTLDASGNLTPGGGTFVSSFGNFGQHTGGSFTIDGTGSGSGGVLAGGGGKSFDHLKMDPSKSTIMSVISESPNGVGISLGIKAGSTFLPTLNVGKSGTGTGTVTSDPSGINCGTTCLVETFGVGNSVTLTATAEPHSTFAGWSGACTENPCVVTMSQAQSVTATFTLDTFGLTIQKGGTGTGAVTSTPSGIDCGSTCSQSFGYNTVVTLTATADPHSTFTGWSGSGITCPGIGTCQVTITQAQSVTATFTLDTFGLTIQKGGTGTGAVTSTPSGIDCGSTCSQSFGYNTVVTLTASATGGAVFTGWSGSGITCLGTGTCQVTMTQAWGVTATFDPPTASLTVTVAGSSPGSVSSTPTGINGCSTSCTASFPASTEVTLTASPGTGGTFKEWRGACTGAGACKVTMSTAMNVTAVFTKTFTDGTLTVGSTPIKAVHVTDLRAAIDTLRSHYSGLGAFTWTDPILTVRSTPVKRQHLIDLRTALDEAYTKAGRAHDAYTDPTITAGTTPIKAGHLTQLRTFVTGLE